MSSPKRVGLALSGGAVRGAAHIGVLEVLEEHGIRPYCVAGTSAGSAVGVVYCAGMSLAQIKEVALNLQWGKLGRVVRPRLGFFDGSRVEAYLIELIGDRTFDELAIPFAAVAADILNDELVVLREGRVAPAVRASCALPGVFTPVEYEGRLLVDGGLINNLPVSAVREMGADYVIAVDLLPLSSVTREPPANLLEVWYLSLFTLMRNTHREASQANVVIYPSLGQFGWIDLSNVPSFIERGRRATEAMMPRILRDLNVEDKVGS